MNQQVTQPPWCARTSPSSGRRCRPPLLRIHLGQAPSPLPRIGTRLHGRLTPLVVDPPRRGSRETLELVVMLSGTPGCSHEEKLLLQDAVLPSSNPLTCRHPPWTMMTTRASTRPRRRPTHGPTRLQPCLLCTSAAVVCGIEYSLLSSEPVSYV